MRTSSRSWAEKSRRGTAADASRSGGTERWTATHRVARRGRALRQGSLRSFGLGGGSVVRGARFARLVSVVVRASGVSGGGVGSVGPHVSVVPGTGHRLVDSGTGYAPWIRFLSPNPLLGRTLRAGAALPLRCLWDTPGDRRESGYGDPSHLRIEGGAQTRRRDLAQEALSQPSKSRSTSRTTSTRPVGTWKVSLSGARRHDRKGKLSTHPVEIPARPICGPANPT
jgi:hypothetical protein